MSDVVLYENKKKIEKNGVVKKIDEIDHWKRIGLKFEEKSQVDTLTFVPLSQKVLSILNGNPNFTADDTVETDFDEPEAESWDSANDDVEVFPIDEYSDKVDVKEVLANNEKQGEVIATAVKELQDKETKVSEPVPETKTDTTQETSSN